MPIGIKDLFCTEGVPSQAGSKILEGYLPPYTATSVRNLYAAGGTLLVLGHDTTNLADGHGGPRDASVLYTAEDLVPALGDLLVERAEAVERSVPLEDGEAVAIDAFVRAHRIA